MRPWTATKPCERQGFDPRIHRVDTATALGHALGGQWDVVLTDYALPGFSGLEAIALVRERAPHLPVILMSGTVGDDKLVEAMKAGGADYILKGNLSRLGPAIRREMEDAEAARLRREAERARREAEKRAAEALRKREERYRQIVDGPGGDLGRRCEGEHHLRQSADGGDARHHRGRPARQLHVRLHGSGGP